MKLRRQKKSDNSINLTPLIDVVFLLLIFFMVSTTFTKETRLLVDLPEADGEAAPAQTPDSIEILVTEEGNYAVNGTALVNRRPDTLIAALEQVSEGDRSIPLVITADADASHQAVVIAMDAAGRSGFPHLSITTRQPEENSP